MAQAARCYERWCYSDAIHALLVPSPAGRRLSSYNRIQRTHRVSQRCAIQHVYSSRTKPRLAAFKHIDLRLGQAKLPLHQQPRRHTRGRGAQRTRNLPDDSIAASADVRELRHERRPHRGSLAHARNPQPPTAIHSQRSSTHLPQQSFGFLLATHDGTNTEDEALAEQAAARHTNMCLRL